MDNFLVHEALLRQLRMLSITDDAYNILHFSLNEDLKSVLGRLYVVQTNEKLYENVFKIIVCFTKYLQKSSHISVFEAVDVHHYLRIAAFTKTEYHCCNVL